MRKFLCALFAAALSCAAVNTFAMADDGIKIDFKQIRGVKPQSPLTVQESDLTPVAVKQLEKIFAEGGMMDIPSFNQENTASMSSCIYNIKISSHGKTHNATIDDKAAPVAYEKLIRFIMKHGHKPVEETASTESEKQPEVAQAQKEKS